MSDSIRIHTMKIREQFVVPILSARLKAITRLNSQGYNSGDYLRFKVIPMLNDSDRWMSTTSDERNKLEGSFYKITFVMSGRGVKESYVTLSIEQVADPKQATRLEREIARTSRDRGASDSPNLDVYSELLDDAFPETIPNEEYAPSVSSRSLDALAAEAEAASEHDYGNRFKTR